MRYLISASLFNKSEYILIECSSRPARSEHLNLISYKNVKVEENKKTFKIVAKLH